MQIICGMEAWTVGVHGDNIVVARTNLRSRNAVCYGSRG